MNDPSAKRLVSPLSRPVNRGHGSRSSIWRKVALATSLIATLSASLFSPAALAAEAPLATGERHVLAVLRTAGVAFRLL